MHTEAACIGGSYVVGTAGDAHEVGIFLNILFPMAL